MGHREHGLANVQGFGFRVRAQSLGFTWRFIVLRTVLITHLEPDKGTCGACKWLITTLILGLNPKP